MSESDILILKDRVIVTLGCRKVVWRRGKDEQTAKMVARLLEREAEAELERNEALAAIDRWIQFTMGSGSHRTCECHGCCSLRGESDGECGVLQHRCEEIVRELYGKGWHRWNLNGDSEPLDSWFESNGWLDGLESDGGE